MRNRLPAFSDKQKICNICEGNEIYAYLEKLIELNVWNTQYEILPDNAADEEVIFGNPCTMQIITKYWTDKNLKSPVKKVNAPLIKELYGCRKLQGKSGSD